MDARLTQDHRRGTSSRKRRVCEQQEEQEATREQGCTLGAEAGTHSVARRVQLPCADPGLWARA